MQDYFKNCLCLNLAGVKCQIFDVKIRGIVTSFEYTVEWILIGKGGVLTISST